MGTISVYAKLDVNHVLEEIPTDDLQRETMSREASTLRDVLERGDPAELPTLLERLARPKWPSVAWCQRAYDEAMGR